jgi:hypothetical protein
VLDPFLSAARSSSSSISLSTFFKTPVTTPSIPLLSSTPYTFRSTLLACSLLPTLTKYRGVSGRKNSKQNCIPAGKAPKPTIHLHPLGMVENSQPMIYATTCPPVMNSADTTTMRPRTALGASSLIYIGTTKLALPTAAPTMLRPTIIHSTDVEKACTSAPIMNSTSARKMMVRRPSVSARTPVSGEARSAKNEVEDVMRDLSRVVRGRFESEEFIEIRVEDMTPVLHHTHLSAST